ncbi:hypothetical protein ACOSQ3_024507 [Xanthoceras sorbifolium]
MVRRNMLIDVHEHGIALDEKKKKVKCNYCGKVVSGFYRLKCHLGSLRGDVVPCGVVPSNVKDLMMAQLLENKRKSLTKEVGQLCHPDLPLKRKWTASAKAELKSDQVMVSTIDEKQVPAESSMQAHNTNEQNDVKQIEEYVKKVRDSWPVTGCSILIEEWDDDKGRHLVNFLIDCLEGTIYIRSFDLSTYVGSFNAFEMLLQEVMEDVGLKNVVQIIISSTITRLWRATKDIVSKRKNMCWSLGASYCIGLMLYYSGMIRPFREILNKAMTLTKFIHGHTDVLTMFRSYSHGHDLVSKPYKIRPLMAFFTMGNIVSQKNNMKDMVASSEWTDSIWASATEGKWVVDLLRDVTFWRGGHIFLAAVTPLVRILVPINGIDKLLVGSIYNSILQAKKEIKNKLGNKASFYMPFWRVIDFVWDVYLHRPLHAAGYYLNPGIFYSENFHVDGEVATGLESCILNMVEDPDVQTLIYEQLEEYTQGKGAFKDGSTLQGIEDVSPIEWWSCYGAQCPELQKFAVHILSQTCDGTSRYDLKKSLAEELLLTNERLNPTEHQRLKDLTFVEYNKQLKNSKMKAFGDIYVSTDEKIDPMDDWSLTNIPPPEQGS